MKWVLLWVIYFNQTMTSGGHEFDNEMACRNAAQTMVAGLDSSIAKRSTILCVEKGR